MLAHSLMLRASSETTETPVDPRALADRSIDPLIPGGHELLDLVDAVVPVSTASTDTVRSMVVDQLSPDALVDAVGVIGNFELMNRIADATGIPVGKGALARTEQWRSDLHLDRFRH